jgi:hypothetical protein
VDAQTIISRLDGGEKWQQLAGFIDWGAIPVVEREKLFAEAEKRSTQANVSDNLIRALGQLSARAKDSSSTIRSCTLLMRRPDLELEDRKRVLDLVRRQLQTLSGTIQRDDELGLRQYRLHVADFLALQTDVDLQTPGEGALQAAIDKYSEAQTIWDRYEQPTRAEWAGDQVRMLKSMQEHKETLVPMDQLRSESAELMAKSEAVRERLRAESAKLEETTHRSEELSAENANLMTQARKMRSELDRVQAEVHRSNGDVQDLASRIRSHEAALHFLMVLPRAASGPLWAEVVRVALDQGEIDSFTQQALERLVISCPEEALPVLAEVAARAPEPFRWTEREFRDAATGWMIAAAEANALKQKGDFAAAAQRLLDMWAAFPGTSPARDPDE